MDSAVFPEAAFTFYEGLRADNSKAYWTAHKDVYDEAVRAPMRTLLEALEPEFGATPVMFRPYRDIRFSKDKTPYKTTQGGFLERAPGVGYTCRSTPTACESAAASTPTTATTPPAGAQRSTPPPPGPRSSSWSTRWRRPGSRSAAPRSAPGPAVCRPTILASTSCAASSSPPPAPPTRPPAPRSAPATKSFAHWVERYSKVRPTSVGNAPHLSRARSVGLFRIAFADWIVTNAPLRHQPGRRGRPS
jgi:hypothetical protein